MRLGFSVIDISNGMSVLSSQDFRLYELLIATLRIDRIIPLKLKCLKGDE